MITHARSSFLALTATGVALLLFAASRLLFAVSPPSPDTVLTMARRALSSGFGAQYQPLMLDRFEIDERDYRITYSVGPDEVQYFVRINRNSGRIEDIAHENSARPAERKSR